MSGRTVTVPLVLLERWRDLLRGKLLHPADLDFGLVYMELCLVAVGGEVGSADRAIEMILAVTLGDREARRRAGLSHEQIKRLGPLDAIPPSHVPEPPPPASPWGRVGQDEPTHD